MARSEIIMSSDEGQLLSAMQKLHDQQKKLEDRFKKTGQAAQTAGNKGKSANQQQQTSGQIAGQQLKLMASGWIGIGAAIGVATKALQQHNEERNKGFETARSLFDARQKLAQVEEDRDLGALADKLAAQFGTPTFGRREAAEFVFSAQSEGFLQDAARLARFAPVLDPQAAAVTAGQLPTLFKGAEEVGSVEATALTLAAAKESRLDFSALAATLPTAAQGAVAAGSSFEETLALQSVLTSKFKSGDVAAGRIGSLGSLLALQEEGPGADLKELGIVEAVRRLSADDELRRDVLGSNKEANEAFRSIQQLLPTIEQRTQLLAGERGLVGTPGGILEQRLARATDTKEERGVLTATRAEIGRDIAREGRFAVQGAKLKTAEERFFEGAERREVSAFGRLGAQAAISTAGLGEDADDTDVRFAGLAGEAAGNVVPIARHIQTGGTSFILEQLLNVGKEQVRQQEKSNQRLGGAAAANRSAQVGRHVE